MHKLLAYFACEVCGRHFYIQKTDLVKHLTGEIKRPFRLNRGMFVKDGDDNWQLVFTVVS